MSAGKTKLDMKHGFMKSIIRNQFDRDNYDKEVKAKVEDQVQVKGGRHKQSRHKKPELRTYVPPFSRSKTSETSVCSDRDHDAEIQDDREELFLLEYEDKDRRIYKRKIFKTDTPEDVASRIGHERHLSPPFINALAQRLAEEMQKRQNSTNSSKT